MEQYKRTALYKTHIELGAKMICYSGFYMPLYYHSSLKEHMSVRNTSGIFDVSHMGKLIIHGEDSSNIIQYLTTNNINKISYGNAQYTCLVNKYGGIIDDIVIYKINKFKFLLIVNSSNSNKNKNWIKNYINNIGSSSKIIDLSLNYSLFAIQGPSSIIYLQKLTNLNLSEIRFYQFKIGDLCNISNILISRTGYTGSKGIEVLIPNKYADKIWKSILYIGKGKIYPCGISSRDSLRMEMGYRLYGKDLSENITPIESGLSWIVSMNKDFIAKHAIKTQLEYGTKKKFFSFFLEKRIIPREGSIIINKLYDKIGYVTSGNFSPILKKGIGIGYLYTKKQKLYPLYVIIRNKKIPILYKKVPFISINNN